MCSTQEDSNFTLKYSTRLKINVRHQRPSLFNGMSGQKEKKVLSEKNMSGNMKSTRQKSDAFILGNSGFKKRTIIIQKWLQVNIPYNFYQW